MAYLGGCRCGTCRYKLDYDGLPVAYACHCLDCQTMTGSAFSLHALVPADRFACEGELVSWDHANSHGKLTSQKFCATCKTRIFSTNEGRPGTVIVRMGTLDESPQIIPSVHLWVKRKQSWIGLPEGAETYEEGISADRAKLVMGANFT